MCEKYLYLILTQNNLFNTYLLPAERKGCHPGSKGCKDQLMI